jgi:hypothetical protein
MRRQVLPEFTVVQHERDVQLLIALKEFFGCGVVRSNHGNRSCFRVRRRSDLLRTIVPFFREHPLQSRKREAFETFVLVLRMMESDEHLSEGGVERIHALASGMNRGRSR